MAYRGRNHEPKPKPPKNPPVTILIPTFNRKSFLPLALRSALEQTYPNIRVLIFDDGSTDTTLKWLAEHPDARLTVLAGRKNRGIAKARQTLLDATETEFNAWLDSDDVRNAHSIELQMAAMTKWEPPFVRTSTQVLVSRSIWRQPPTISYAKRHSIATSLFRKSCAPQFRTDLRYFGEDIVWEMDMAIKHGTGIILPFDCYYIGRGRHGRATAAVNSKPKQRNKSHYEKLKKERHAPLRAMGINPLCRVERIGPADITTSFSLPQDTNTELPAIYRMANLCTSQRVKAKPGFYRIARCPLCGFRLNGTICSQCGHDWTGQCWVPESRLLAETVQE